jgi:hypothetical protein
MLEPAILQAVAYADVFDFPLRPEEIHRYLAGVAASCKSVREALRPGAALAGQLGRQDEFITLLGREALVDTRRRRAEVAARMWTRALDYGQQISRLPFVRMVAVTGALAMDNVEPGADIDYLIVTASGRLWLCRALVILIVRLAARRGDTVCPNFFLSERALLLKHRDFYTAHELAQMVPLAGLETYDRMRLANLWTHDFLPNAADAPDRDLPTFRSSRLPPAKQAGEWLLRSTPGGWLERWEMERKIRKFTRPSSGRSQPVNTEIGFSPDWCKGHADGHARRTLASYQERLQRLGIPLPGAYEPAILPRFQSSSVPLYEPSTHHHG